MNAPKARNTPKQRVEAFRRTLGLSAKMHPGRSYGHLYDKVYRADVLREAWNRVSAHGGSAGVDGVSIRWIREYGVDRYLDELGTVLREKRYKPNRIRRVLIPKPDGRQRPLGIPTVTDRVVQMAVKLVIEPLNEAKTRVVHATAGFEFLGFRFRPGVYVRNGRSRTTLIKVPGVKALAKIRQGIKTAVKSLALNEPVARAVQAANLRLRGWANYFRIGHAYRHLKAMVWHAETQVRIFIRRKFQRKGSLGSSSPYPSKYLHEHLGLYTVEVLYAGR